MDFHPSKRRRLDCLMLKDSQRGSDISISRTSSAKRPACQDINRSAFMSNESCGPSPTFQNGGGGGQPMNRRSTFSEIPIRELLNGVRPKYESRMVRVERVIQRLKDIIESIPQREGLPAHEAHKILEQSSNVRIPFLTSNPMTASNIILAYSRPANIDIVGSYARKTALLLGSRTTVDVAVTMPSDLFHDKDYRDYRYFHKRAYFLACLAAGLQNANVLDFGLSFTYQDDNPLQPIIVVRSSRDNSGSDFAQARCDLRIILTASSDLFPIEQTLPTKSNIKISATGLLAKDVSPIYNATLRSECCSSISREQLNQSCVQSNSFRDACMLGAIWLHQRGFGSSMSAGGFGQFEWASLISALMRVERSARWSGFSTGLSSYQLFKRTLQYLATTEMTTTPVIVLSNSFRILRTEKPVFFDGSRGMNVLFKMSPWSYERLRHEATFSLRALNHPLVDSFKSLFISKVYQPHRMYDYLFRISPNPITTATPSRDSESGPLAILANDLHEKFSYGLGNRATLIHPMVPKTSPWPFDISGPILGNQADVLVGLLLDPDHCRRIVDRGPSIDDKTASAFFRQFWGDKAELRRFKDGTILESLVWDDSDPEHSVICQITTYILCKQFGQQVRASPLISEKFFDTLLPRQTATQQDVLEQFSAVTNAFDSLSKSLRAMDSLPLQIRTLLPASPELRFSSLSVPVAGNPDRLGRPIGFYVQFEYSMRWPGDLAAIQRTKIGFLLKIANYLEKDTSVSAVRLGLDHSNSKLLKHSFLDITTTYSIVFRLRIYHEHELELLGQPLNGPGLLSESREEVALAVAEFKRKYTQGPTHTQAVATLITRYPILSLTIRLLKRWRDCHLLSSQIRDELIELLAVRSFACPYPWATPGSLRAAFFRTLAFVASWDWQSEPLIVDFKSDLSKQEIDGIHLRFKAWRRLDPSMNRVAMFVASNLDREGVTWTENRLPRIIATRFTNLAKASINLADEQDLELNPEALFIPSLAGYDFVIHLKHDHSAADRERLSFKNMQVRRQNNAVDAMLDPTQHFFNELQSLYGENVIFFQNESAPTVIAGLWNPQTGPRNWKINLNYSTVPMHKREGAEPQVTINKTSILNDIARMGINVITRIDEEVSKHFPKHQT